jgi:tRNA threonylcarbamoyladenosine biosynthesis protein TsaB
LLLEEIHEDVVFLGDGAERYRQLIGNALRGKARFAPPFLNYPRASTIAHLAFQKGLQVPFSESLSVTPLYGRPPEAEIKWGKSR